MKKIFTLIATALMAVSVNAQTEPVVYNCGGITEDKIVVDENSELSSRDFDGDDCPLVKYTGAATEKKMNVKIKGIDLLTLNYSNSAVKNQVITFAAEFINTDVKGIVFILGTDEQKLKEGDEVSVKFAAKGSTAATIKAETNLSGDEASSSSKEDIKIAKFTVGANGTCKFKETTGGARIYAIAINAEIPETTTGFNNVASADKAVKARKALVNGRLVIETANGKFSATGARIK